MDRPAHGQRRFDDLAAAVEHLRRWWGGRAQRASDGAAELHPRPVIGITGPVGSGKSTLARLLAQALGGVVLSTDQYLPDYHLVPEDERDDPRHADLPRLTADLRSLRDTGLAEVPDWSFHQHRRIGSTPLVATGPVLCEGLFALHETARPGLDLAVFVEAPAPLRWSRWEAIEQRGERGWGVERARAHFQLVAEPTFARYAAAYRASADLIVDNRAALTPPR
jgi:uridine kinase